MKNTGIFNNLEKFLDNSYYCCCEYGMKTTNLFMNITDGIFSTEITTRQTTIQTTKIIENTGIFNNLEKFLDNSYYCCCEYGMKTTNLILNKTDGIFSTEITTRQTTIQTTKIIENTGIFNNLEKFLDNSYYCCCEYGMKTTNQFLNKTDGIYSTEITTRQTTIQTTKIIENTGIFNNLEKFLDNSYYCCCEYGMKTTNLFLNKTDDIYSTEITTRQTTKIIENTEIFNNLEKFLDNSYYCCCEYGMKTTNLFLNITDGIFSTEITTRQTTIQTTKIIENTGIFNNLEQFLDNSYYCCCEYGMKTTNLILNKTDGIFSTEITTRQTTIQTTKIIENTGIFNNLEKFLDNSYYCCCEYGMKTTNLFLNKTDDIYSTEITTRQTTKIIENTEIFNNLEKFLDNSYYCCCEYGMKTTNLFLNITDGIFSTEITTRQTTIQTTKIIENTGIFNNLEQFLDNSYYCCCEYGMKTTNLILNKTDGIFSTEITTRQTTIQTTKIIENTGIFNNLEKFLDNSYYCCCEYGMKTTNLFLNKTDDIYSTEITTRKTTKIIENTRIFKNLETLLDTLYSCCCEYERIKTTNLFLNKTDDIFSTEITSRQTTKIIENTRIFNNLEKFLDNSYYCCCEYGMKTTNLFLNITDGIFSTEITTRETTIQTTKIIENTGIFNNLEKFLDNSYYCCCEYGMKTTNLILNKTDGIFSTEITTRQTTTILEYLKLFLDNS